ncbi:hypothetical protein K440DRAFT_521009, partial [Wilcoxina mikolae CBS 423.85]
VNWLDHIIFAMAPLGILTAIIAAIRVGSPSWLRAVVGRARENIATVELELMSSTSHEVCELWNGQGIVRTTGRPEVQQIIYLEDQKGEDTFGLHTVESAMKAGLLRAERTYIEYLGKSAFNGDPPPDTAPQESAPNISLNLHDGSKSGELYTAALCGIILQFGMLVFCGFSIYHPKFSQRFPKNSRPVQGYAFPIMALGTILLMVGMLICSAVVEKSTVEKEYKLDDSNATTTTRDAGAGAENEPNLRPLWLQKGNTVSDQAFDSFVLFGQSSGRRNHILTSRRQQTTPSADPSEESQPRSSTSNPTEAFTLLGVFFGLCGFILQFQGLRGMNWSASIAQLVCIFLMTIWRAWIRRGLIANPVPQRVPENHEMDWLALMI